ncbi:MAG TPA: AI-2E family transporter [Mesotoga infera]|uniref:AI-2E family transporter n=1 Tax=Mesotoga infera TaxID=1236046 RepID=A0A7C1H3C2_9BACT|nr:AI-2E family transporter [Mesotoga infera]
MEKTRLWILGYFIAIFSTLFLFPMTSRVIGLAFLFSLIINAPSAFVTKKTSKTALGIITGLVLLFFLFFLVYSAIPITINGIRSIATEMDALFKDGRFEEWLERLPPFIADSVTDLAQRASQWLSGAAIELGRYVASNITSWITGIILMIVAAFVIARRTGILRRKVPILFPGCNQSRVTGFLDSLYTDFQTYVAGQVLISVIEGIMIGAGAAIVGIPNALFLGLLAGITNFIPFLGVVVTTIPMLVLGYVQNGIWGVIGGAIVLLIANQIDMWLLSPRILSHRVKINWFVVLVSLVAFGELIGIFGVLFAVPLILFIKRFWKEFVIKERSDHDWESTIETGTKKVKEENPRLREENQTSSQED